MVNALCQIVNITDGLVLKSHKVHSEVKSQNSTTFKDLNGARLKQNWSNIIQIKSNMAAGRHLKKSI